MAGVTCSLSDTVGYEKNLIWSLICEHHSEGIIFMQLSNWDTPLITIAIQYLYTKSKTNDMQRTADCVSPFAQA